MKLLCAIAADFGENLYDSFADKKIWENLAPRAMDSAYPALTCPSQAAFRTASGVPHHSMCASGYFDRTLKRAFFWEQSSALYSGGRIWEEFRKKGGKVAQICLQQCPGLDSDIYLSPGPIHKHHGGLIQDFFCEPPELYREICGELDSKFNLMNYWGPFAGVKSSKWICGAAERVMARLENEKDAFVLLYIPHLDYAPQKYGVDSIQARKAFAEFESLTQRLYAGAKQHSFDFVMTGDYAMSNVRKAVTPNLILAKAGLLKLRNVEGMLYPNLHSSRAFALADHQICHIYMLDGTLDAGQVKSLFINLEGVEKVTDRAGSDFDNPRSGEIILEAAKDAWFAYNWWEKKSEAPDYATHVDIHNKPGFDPLEMYLKLWPPMSIETDLTCLKASHGRKSRVMLVSDIPLEAKSFDSLAAEIKHLLTRGTGS